LILLIFWIRVKRRHGGLSVVPRSRPFAAELAGTEFDLANEVEAAASDGLQ
jgi:hypothetical protein